MSAAPPIRVVNIASALAGFNERWSPRLAGAVNDCAVKLVKIEGDFIWHSHEREDEMFLVVRGAFTMRLRPPLSDLIIREGEFVVIPRGVEHCPSAESECHILLFEPATTLNTGGVVNERTRAALPSI